MRFVLWHIAESSAFALLAWGMTFAFKDRAAVKHRLWIAAVCKFALPFGWFGAGGKAIGEYFALAPLRVLVSYTATIEGPGPQTAPISAVFSLPVVCIVVWMAISATLLILWLRRFARSIGETVPASHEEEAAVSRCARRMQLERVPCLRVASRLSEPYVSGTLRPFVVVSQGLCKRLGKEAFEAVLMHELAHVKRKDNLWAIAVHAVVCLFPWYLPLWWMEQRARGEAELACDVLVLQAGASREVYLYGLLEVCRMLLLEPVAGSGLISGVNLKNRLEKIMSNRVEKKTPRVLVHLGAALLASGCSLVFLLGVLGSGRSMAQAATATGTLATVVNGCMAGEPQPFALGIIIRHIDKRMEVCVAQEGRPLWLSLATDHLLPGVKIVDIADPPPVICRETAPHGKLCTCSNLDFSPGAVVGSPRGTLACPASGGKWQMFTGKQTPWPPVSLL